MFRLALVKQIIEKNQWHSEYAYGLTRDKDMKLAVEMTTGSLGELADFFGNNEYPSGWLGGKQDEDGVWRWTNGKNITGVDWEEGSDKPPLCAYTEGGKFYQRTCSNYLDNVLLQGKPVILKDKSVTINYNKAQVLTCVESGNCLFQVWYHRRSNNTKESKQIDFRLAWSIKSLKVAWKQGQQKKLIILDPNFADPPKMNNTRLQKMVGLATQGRKSGLKKQDIMKRALEQKSEMETKGLIGDCLMGQMLIPEETFGKITLGLNTS